MIERQCRNCGEPFEVEFPSSKRTNCSAKCRGVKNRQRADAGTRRTDWLEIACPCGQVIEMPPWKINQQKFCSAACRRRFGLPPKGRPHLVKHARRVAADGYVWIYLPPADRPDGWMHAFYPEHRQIMRGILGRDLLPGENVHHLNGVKQDNRPENLELWVVQQPKGQRMTDVLAWAREVIARYDVRITPDQGGTS